VKRSLILAAALALVAGPAVAETPASAVARARAAGQVGERFDGYLGIAVDGGPLLRHQVQAINIRRRSLYSQFAASRGVTLQEVGITAACQLLGTVGVGERYALNDNVWRVRGAGQVAPVPDYCR
jgi:uncharacterized protein YdbL (DUF1318 family)